MAEYKDKKLKEFIESPIKEGEVIEVKGNLVAPGTNQEYKSVTVKKDNGDTVTVEYKEDYSNNSETFVIPKTDIKRLTRYIGYSPFPDNDWSTHIRNYAYPLDNIINLLYEDNDYKDWYMNGLKVHETNFNPFVFDKDGNKIYYQRDYCWTLEQKQSLIDSICNHINCGQILVRKHSYKWVEVMHNKGEEWACFNDIVDGKQRLNAIYEFMCDKYPMSNGMYYSDFSKIAQLKFNDSIAISYAELDERTTDEQVIKCFLCTNYTGVPQSKEHIEFVKSIYKN